MNRRCQIHGSDHPDFLCPDKGYDKLNKKLAEWAGFEYVNEPYWVFKAHPNYEPFEVYGARWVTPDGRAASYKLPDFTNSLDACFKWLVPKLRELKWKLRLGCGDLSGKFHTQLICWEKEYVRQTRPIISVYDKDNPALALCLAIEKLIDGGN